jgi:predicted ATPase
LLEGAHEATAAAEDHFLQGLDWARRQGALTWELRCATSLARAKHEQQRTAEAHELLSAVYVRFTEGFDTADLKTAKALLSSLQ